MFDLHSVSSSPNESFLRLQNRYFRHALETKSDCLHGVLVVSQVAWKKVGTRLPHFPRSMLTPAPSCSIPWVYPNETDMKFRCVMFSETLSCYRRFGFVNVFWKVLESALQPVEEFYTSGPNETKPRSSVTGQLLLDGHTSFIAWRKTEKNNSLQVLHRPVQFGCNRCYF